MVTAALTLPDLARSSGDLGQYDPVPMAPVLVFDESGSTFGGPVGRSMVVHNNGRVQVSQAAGYLSEPYVFSSHLIPEALQGLLAHLDGWSHLVDEQPGVSDLPLKTLTTIDGQGQARSVSWWLGQGGHDNLENVRDRVTGRLFPQLMQ